MHKRVAMILAFAAFGTALVAGPARSDDRGEIVVSHGQTVTKEFPAIPLPMPLSDISYNPSSCTTPSPYCDRFGLKLNLPAHPEDARLYITLEWRGEQLTSENYCALYLWDDPEVLYSPIKEAYCVDNKAVIDYLPLKRDFQIVVRNFTATASEGYTLKVSYRDYEGQPGVL